VFKQFIHWPAAPGVELALSIQPVQAGLFVFTLGLSTSMAEKGAMDKAWAEAARRCRLSPADVRMAKELGFEPRSLLKSVPSPKQAWKAPVAEWVRELYAKRQRGSEQRRWRRERAQALVDPTCMECEE
jgi:hypothetical protein